MKKKDLIIEIINENSLVSMMNHRENFNPPVSTALYGTTTTSSWAHTVPSLMPWVNEEDKNISCNNAVVHFLATDSFTPKSTPWEVPKSMCINKSISNVPHKRKSDDEQGLFPTKQFITEEKLSARLHEIHISQDYNRPATDNEVGNICPVPQVPNPDIQELDEKSCDTSNQESDALNRSLFLAPEIRNLVHPEKLFSKTIFSDIFRPSKAVVLWKPPPVAFKMKSDEFKHAHNKAQSVLSDFNSSCKKILNKYSNCECSICQKNGIKWNFDPNAME